MRGDFTADRRLLVITAIALPVGALCAVVAIVLLKLIAIFTNLFFYGRLSSAGASPAGHHLGFWVVGVPVAGAVIIGFLARYGSERIRGHGIPEAMEAILIGRSKMSAKVAVLKPLSSAISIGSGGPFGAEGPIIMTGGACGSLIAQAFHLTAAERKTLLVAGAAGGMAATFGTPVAAVLLAVELLLFEWKPRSLVPVALASAIAAALRPLLLGSGPLFPLTPHSAVPAAALLRCALVGLTAGIGSNLLTRAVYSAEDAFDRLPFHWMWWPALGGLVVGVGGLFEPRALGVGYDVIEDLLSERLPLASIAGIAGVKAVIWSVALGSGTSGGVLAPLLIMGGCLGAIVGHGSTGVAPALWPLLGMAGVLGGTMRCPLTGIVFALELTHDANALLPLLIASVVAYGFTVLTMKRSILTEKVARRGYHLTREYAVDPLEACLVAEVMTREVQAVPSTLRARDLERSWFDGAPEHPHQGYPVVEPNGRLVGVVTRSNIVARRIPAGRESLAVADLVDRPPIVVAPDETCRTAAERMAASGVGRLPVVERAGARRLVGIVTRSDLLKARKLHLDLEQLRERPLVAPWQRGKDRSFGPEEEGVQRPPPSAE
jgi:chloride channel protein, CIC family